MIYTYTGGGFFCQGETVNPHVSAFSQGLLKPFFDMCV